jgi:hypothetical protein
MTVGTIDPGPAPRARGMRVVAAPSSRRTSRVSPTGRAIPGPLPHRAGYDACSVSIRFILRVAHAARIAGAGSTATQLLGSI